MCLLEQLTRWDVVLVLIGLLTILGFFTRPLITLVKTLTRLVTVVDTLEKHCAKNEDTNAEEHEKFKEHNAATDIVIAEHGTMLQAHEQILNGVLTNHTQ